MLGWSGPLTNRQFLAWQAWLRHDDLIPDRRDHYLMQIAREVACVLHSNPTQVTLRQFELKPEKKVVAVATGGNDWKRFLAEEYRREGNPLYEHYKEWAPDEDEVQDVGTQPVSPKSDLRMQQVALSKGLWLHRLRGKVAQRES